MPGTAVTRHVLKWLVLSANPFGWLAPTVRAPPWPVFSVSPIWKAAKAFPWLGCSSLLASLHASASQDKLGTQVVRKPASGITTCSKITRLVSAIACHRRNKLAIAGSPPMPEKPFLLDSCSVAACPRTKHFSLVNSVQSASPQLLPRCRSSFQA